MLIGNSVCLFVSLFVCLFLCFFLFLYSIVHLFFHLNVDLTGRKESSRLEIAKGNLVHQFLPQFPSVVFHSAHLIIRIMRI